MTATVSSGVRWLPVLTLLLIFFGTGRCAAQTDTVFINNQKVPCLVKEVTPDMVKFILPGEQVLNSVYLTTVQKIVFQNGRVQTFAEANYHKVITSVMDYDNVTVAASNDDIQGMYAVASVSVKSTGVPAYSTAENVKDRAYQRIKVQAAMYGANMVYVTSQSAAGSDLDEGASPVVELSGTAYSARLPDIEKFRKLIEGKNNLWATMVYKIGMYNGGLSHDPITKPFKIYNVKNENGVVKLDADLDGEKNVHLFQLAGFDTTGFNIAYAYNRTTYNLRISWQ